MLAVVTPDTPPDVVRRRHSNGIERRGNSILKWASDSVGAASKSREIAMLNVIAKP